MAAEYRYLFADLLSDADIAEIDLTNVSMDRRIIQPGSFSADIPIPNRQVGDQVRRILPDPTTGNPTSICHAYQNGNIWGSYVIWTWAVSVSERGFTSISIQGATLESWLNRRLLDADKTFSQVDQLEIARQLVLEAQAGWLPYLDAANLGITSIDGDSGVKRDRTYLRTEAASVGKRLEELANVEDGFEYFINTWLDETTGARRREFVPGYPGLGQQETAHSFEMPGNITSLKVTQDLTAGGTAFWARGDTPEQDQTAAAQPLMTTQPLVVDSLLQRGWPWLDSVSDHQGVTKMSTLQSYAQWYASTQAGAVRTIEVSVRLPDDNAFHPSRLGDFAMLTAVTEYWPLDEQYRPTFSALVRVVGIQLKPATRGTGVDIAQLVLADQSEAPDYSLAGGGSGNTGGGTSGGDAGTGGSINVSAGDDTSMTAGSTFTRTAVEPTAGVTSRGWTIVSGPMGEGTTIATTAALSWLPGSSADEQATVDIRQPIVMECAFELTSTAENSTTDWKTAYPYMEDIGDGRGYTGGLIGFTSSTADMLELVQYYTQLSSGNSLAKYISALQTTTNVGPGDDASSSAASNLGKAFRTAWANAANTDPVFRRAQRDLRKKIYWDDALTQALADGVGPLGMCLHYDILVNHGPGTDSESYGGILAAARASTSKAPSAGGDEAAYLTKLCDLRDAVLQGWGDYQSDGRSTIFRALIGANKLTLIAPFTWSVYGESFTKTQRGPVPTDAVLGTYVLRYTANSATDDVTVTVT